MSVVLLGEGWSLVFIDHMSVYTTIPGVDVYWGVMCGLINTWSAKDMSRLKIYMKAEYY